MKQPKKINLRGSARNIKRATKGRKTYVIDLFCGAGGTSTAIFKSNTNIEVIACINHDRNAIMSHSANYPNCLHLTEDIRTVGLMPILKIMNKLREEDPTCLFAIWASLECTNYSKAKGGLARDADSRSLAEHLFRYLDVLCPDFLWIENVREFMAWGPLNDKGKPVSLHAGNDFLRWVEKVKAYGFDYDHRILNSANFGAYTSRERYFGQFSKSAMAWPMPTHAKVVKEDMWYKPELFDDEPMQQWKPVREVLDLEDEGVSIFHRKKPLVENTLKRIYAGLVKFVASGKEDSFLQTYNSGKEWHRVRSLDGPASTVCTANTLGIIKAVYLSRYNGNVNDSSHISLERPCGTLMTKDTFAKVEAQFMVNYQYKSGAHSLSDPSPTILTKDKFAPVTVNFLDNQYGNSKPSSVDQPSGSITGNPKQAIVSTSQYIMTSNFTGMVRSTEEPSPTILASRKHHYLVNPQYASKGRSIHDPCFSLIARMDKAPPSIICTEGSGQMISVSVDHPTPYFLSFARIPGTAIALFTTDNPTMVKIKLFMMQYGISDIKMRMLKVSELLPIQGFPADYKLIGTEAEKKKYIGNSVEVNVGMALFRAIDNAIQRTHEESHYRSA